MAAVAFTLGFRPRASAAVLWLFTVSLHGRQPALYDMSDQVRPPVVSKALPEESVAQASGFSESPFSPPPRLPRQLLANLLLWAVFLPLTHVAMDSRGV